MDVGSHERDREDRIRERAYRLWQADGGPEGRALHYWLAAEQAEAEAEVGPEDTAEYDAVEEASDESFPASDPPARTVILGPA